MKLLGIKTNSTDIIDKQYVDGAVASKANDSSVVHLTGNEDIAGNKSFTGQLFVSTLPVEDSTGNSVTITESNDGENCFLHVDGSLDATIIRGIDAPLADRDAANKSYVDSSVSGKQNASTLETDVKAFINAEYIASLIADGTDTEY